MHDLHADIACAQACVRRALMGKVYLPLLAFQVQPITDLTVILQCDII